MAERREAGLRRGVSRRLLASVLLVNLAMAVFVSLGVVADEALGMTPLVFVVAGIVFLLVLLAYIEGTAMLPQSGGAAGFARRGLGELSSFLVGWSLLLDYLILVVLTAYFAVHYLGSIPGFDELLAWPHDTIASAALIVAGAVFSLRGVRAGAKTAFVISMVALGAQLLLAILGLVLVFEPDRISAHLELGTTPTWAGVLFALPIAMIGFTGLDTVANLGDELDEPGREIPRPLIWSAVVSVLVFVSMSIVALNAQPVHGAGESAATPLGATDGWVDRPVIGILDGLGLSSSVEDAMRTIIGLLAAAVLFLASNAALAGMARIAYFMGRHRQAPKALFRVDRRTGAPKFAVIILTSVALQLLLLTVSLSDSAVVLAQV
jgi:APA family basic amino acid/polyamine antiporter